MSDELEDATSFAVLRPLIISTLKDLKEESKTQASEIAELKTQHALLNQKVAMYAAGIGGAVAFIVEIARDFL